MRVRLPVPASWQDFEALCHQLWKEIWCDPNAQRNGRAGQAQAGVDIYGNPIYTSNLAGVQCKDKDSRLGSTLTETELISECSKAVSFTPQLHTFTLATTSSRDAIIQSSARSLNSQKQFPFNVHVWSWDDIEAEVACRPTLCDAFYPSAPHVASDNTVKIAISAPKDQFNAFFTRPQLNRIIRSPLKESILEVVYELCDNAFLHGKAQHVQLSFDGSLLTITDDGLAFNPITELDASKASKSSHLGSLVLQEFQSEYRDCIDIKYSRATIDNKEQNIFSIQLSNAVKHINSPEVMDITVNMSAMFGRYAAEQWAASLVIPPGLKELVITVPQEGFGRSSSAQFIYSLRTRLPSSVLLVISHPRDHWIGRLAELFDSSKVRFQSR